MADGAGLKVLSSALGLFILLLARSTCLSLCLWQGTLLNVHCGLQIATPKTSLLNYWRSCQGGIWSSNEQAGKAGKSGEVDMLEKGTMGFWGDTREAAEAGMTLGTWRSLQWREGWCQLGRDCPLLSRVWLVTLKRHILTDGLTRKVLLSPQPTAPPLSAHGSIIGTNNALKPGSKFLALCHLQKTSGSGSP
jgi:hypothetical protein